MSDNSNYPPGVTDRTIARANGEVATCQSCGKEFLNIYSGSEICPRCEREESLGETHFAPHD